MEVIEDSFSGGIFQAINADGEEEDIELASRAAAYLPPDYANSPNPGLGLVYAVHFADSVKAPIAGRIALEYGIPVLYHGEEPEDWKSLGYPPRRSPKRSRRRTPPDRELPRSPRSRRKTGRSGSTGAGSNVGGSPGAAGDRREQLDRVLAPDEVGQLLEPDVIKPQLQARPRWTAWSYRTRLVSW